MDPTARPGSNTSGSPAPPPPRSAAVELAAWLSGAPDSERVLADMIALAPAAIAVLDGPEHRYALVNPAYRRLARGKGELLGRTLPEVWPEAGPAIVAVLDRVFATGVPFEAADQPFQVERDRGPETIWLTFSFLPLRGAGGRIERIFVMTNEVTEHMRALASARELAARLERSNAFTAALSSAQTRAEVARTVFEKGLAVVGADAGALALVPADAPGQVELVEHCGYPAELIDRWRRFPLGLRSPLTDAIRQREAVWVESPAAALARFPDWAPAVAAQPDRTWVALPLVVGDRVTGALALTYYAERPLDDDERRLLRSVADRCAQALDRAQALDDARARAHELETVLDAVPVPVFLTRDAEATRIDANRAAQELLGIGAHQNASLRLGPDAPRPFTPVRDGVPLRLDEMPMQAAARFGRETHDFEYDIVRADGTVRHVVANAQPILDAAGRPRGAVGAFMDVTARREAERALKESEARLRESDRRKTEFLAVLSHELRNPLAPIRNGLALLESAPPGSEVGRRALEVLHRQTGHLARLVDDLLDMTRISHGKVELHRASFDLRDVARQACEDHRALLDRAGIALEVVLAPEPVRVAADATRIAQVVDNLLQNSAKFTPAGGRVAVAVRSAPAGAEVAVRDTGAGIAAEDLGRLFEPFSQAPQGLARSRGGLGLGLALVRGLVELHGGTVRAWSDGPGQGAEFVVTLPPGGAPGEVGVPAAPRAAGTGPSRLVVVVEDNADAALTLADVLELHGHRVSVARDGASGIALARELRPDVVLCDIGLPDVDGYQVARTLRADPDLAATRLVALSGYAQPEDRARAREAGFDAHVAKPPDPEALLAVVAGNGAAS